MKKERTRLPERQEKSSPAQGAYCVTVTEHKFDQGINKGNNSPFSPIFQKLLVTWLYGQAPTLWKNFENIMIRNTD